jgi:hypothetical protein
MLFQGFHGVTGTGGRESAMLANKGAEYQTVDLDKADQESRHC